MMTERSRIHTGAEAPPVSAGLRYFQARHHARAGGGRARGASRGGGDDARVQPAVRAPAGPRARSAPRPGELPY